MPDGQKTRLKRLIRKYEFLLEDWAEVEEISIAANGGMSAELHRHMPPEVKPSDFEVEETEEEKERKDDDVPLKKLFRKIVVKCHPDKVDQETSELRKLELIDLYEKAVEAHDDNNWALMVVVAIKLDVDLPEEAEDMVSEIDEEAKKLEEKIKSTTNSMAWKWYYSEEEEKEAIVNNYLAIIKKSKEKSVQTKKESKKESKLILGVGHPRTGTGYTAKLLQSWGLDVGHESMGEHGTVDWSLAPGEKSLWQGVNFKDFEWEHIIYCVRDPRDSIASIAYTENVEPSLGFRKKFSEVIGNKNAIISAIVSIITWDRIITRSLNPSFTYRVEDGSEELFKYLKDSGVEVNKKEIVEKNYNSREHKSFEELLDDSGFISSIFKDGINAYCDKYGYSRLF